MASFQELLERAAGSKLQLRINDNRSTMLSVKHDPGATKVSLHHMFLSAPMDVICALGSYLKRKNERLAPNVKAFIAEGLKKLDYSADLDPSSLVSQGRVYNLKRIYNAVNRDYFDRKLDLHITWTGEYRLRSRSRITYGLYDHQLRLIKIYRIMDRITCPEYVVSFVVYHEMLHHVLPPYVDKKGRHCIHGPEFKLREREHQHYHQAQQWIFKQRNRGRYGWS